MMSLEPFCYRGCYPVGVEDGTETGQVVGVEALAGVAEQVDAKVSKTFACKGVRVRVPPSAL